MIPHLRYGLELLRHKIWVLVEGRRLGLPWGRLLRHDLSKLRPDEWGPSVRFHHSRRGPSPHSAAEREASERALALHRSRNPHHPEHWVRREGGRTEVLPMPDPDRREMLADWRAVGRVRGGSAAAWYRARATSIPLHPETRAWLEARLGVASTEVTP